MLQNVLLAREIYSSEEHKMTQKMIQDFINNEIMDQQDEWEKNGMVSRAIWERAGELGLLCIDIPEEYGGGGLDFSFSALFIEELGRRIVERRERRALFRIPDDVYARAGLYHCSF